MHLPGHTRALSARLLAAGTGVIAVHQVAYLLAHPSAAGRAAAADGHGYLATVATVVLPVAAAVAAWAVICRLSGSPTPARPTPVARTRDYAGLFAAQEVLERVADGGSGLSAFAEPAVWLGFALVPLLPLIGRLLHRSLERVDARPVAIVAAPQPPVAALVSVAPDLPLHPLVPTLRRVRGPPPLLR